MDLKQQDNYISCIYNRHSIYFSLIGNKKPKLFIKLPNKIRNIPIQVSVFGEIYLLLMNSMSCK